MREALTPRNVKTAANPSTYASAWRTASQRDEPAAAASSPRTTATTVSCARYAGTSGSTHGEMKLMMPAPKASRRVRAEAGMPSGAPAGERIGQEGSDGTGPEGQRQPATVEFQHRDLLEELTFRRGIVGDPALDERGGPKSHRGALGEQRMDQRARVVTQVAPVAAPQHEIGEGSGDCRRIHRRRLYGGVRRSPSCRVEYDRCPRPRSSVDRARPS